MEAIDTAQLSELLMVLKTADVRRFKSGTVEIEFAAPEMEAHETTPAVGFVAEPLAAPMKPYSNPEDPGEDVPAHLPPSYHKLFGKQIPKFPTDK